MSILSTYTGLVVVDSRDNSGTVTLPLTSENQGRAIIFKDEFLSFGNNPLYISTSGSDTFEDGTTGFSLNQFGGFAKFIGVSNVWYKIESSSNLDAYTQRLSVSSLTAGTISVENMGLSSINASSISVYTLDVYGPSTLTVAGTSILNNVSVVSSFTSDANYLSSITFPDSSVLIATSNGVYLNDVPIGGGGGITEPDLVSTIEGLGTFGFLSSYSSSVFVDDLVSSLEGLGSLGYISSVTDYSTAFRSTVDGLGSSGYVSSVTTLFSSLSLGSAVLGLFVTSSNLEYTVNLTNFYPPVSGLIDFSNIYVTEYAPSLNTYIAGGYGGTSNNLIYSTDGVNWNQPVSGGFLGNAGFKKLSVNGPKLLAVGSKINGSGYPVLEDCIQTSVDGSNWVPSGSSNLNASLWAAGYVSTNLWVVGGFVENSVNSSTILTSVDTSNWVESSSNNFVTVYGFAGNGSNIVAVGYSPSNTYSIQYSVDYGQNWSNATNTFNAMSNNADVYGGVYNSPAHGAVTWNGSLYVATGDDSSPNSRVKYSSDGINWSNSSNNYGAGYEVTWRAPYFYITGEFGIQRSLDGVNWSLFSPPIGKHVAINTNSNISILSGTLTYDNDLLFLNGVQYGYSGQQIVSSLEGLGTLGYISSLSLASTVTGISTMIVNSISSLLSSYTLYPRLGNTLTVDHVNGDDSRAAPSGVPFKTVNGALSQVLPGDTIWILPGTYFLSSPIVMLSNTSLRGLSLQTVQLIMSNVTSNTTMLTMAENCRVEDVNLYLHSAGHYDLVGIEFPGTTHYTAKLRTAVVTVDNSNASSNGTSAVNALHFTGSNNVGARAFSFNSLKGSTANLFSNGNGRKRGILITGNNAVISTRDMNIFVAAPVDSGSTGSYVGIETSNATCAIQLRATTIGGPVQTGSFISSDILQTLGSIEIGPGTDIVNKTAGTSSFTTYVYPTVVYYGVKGDLSNAGQVSGFLWPGSMTAQQAQGRIAAYPDPVVSYYRVQQRAIMNAFTAYLTSGPQDSASTHLTVQVNGADTPFKIDYGSNDSGFKVFSTASYDLKLGDLISLKLDLSSITTNLSHDLTVQLDLF
jgi:hypothetical protein